MIDIQEVNDYISFIESNPERVNKKRKQLIKNIVKPLLERSDVFFDEKMYHKCLTFCEKYYYPLFPYQRFVYAFVFMYEKETNFPIFDTFFIFMGRGNGKDGFLMPLISFLLTPVYGIKNYDVDIVANSEDQAKDTFNVVWNMLDDHPKLDTKFKRTKEEIQNKKTRSTLAFNTSSAKTKDGKRDGAIVFNELHAYEDYEQIKVYESGLGKIEDPRKFIISTNGNVRGGPLDDYLDLSDELLETGENVTNMFPFLCCLDNPNDWEKEELWELANPSMEFMPVLKNQIRKDYYEAKKLPEKINEFKAKRLNISIDKQEAVGIAVWEDIVKTTELEDGSPRPIPELDGQMCIAAVDYADIRDFVSAGLLFKINGEDVWIQKTWICKNSPFFKNIKFPFDRAGQNGYEDFEVVDCKSIDPDLPVLWLVEQSAKYSIQKVIIDTYRAQLLKSSFEKYGFSIETKEDPYGMVRTIRRMNSIYALTVPTIEKGFTDGTINFCNSRIMRWYTRNTGVSTDKYGNKALVKIEPKLRKNDGMSAFIDAKSQESLLEEQIIYI